MRLLLILKFNNSFFKIDNTFFRISSVWQLLLINLFFFKIELQGFPLGSGQYPATSKTPGIFTKTFPQSVSGTV